MVSAASARKYAGVVPGINSTSRIKGKAGGASFLVHLCKTKINIMTNTSTNKKQLLCTAHP